MASTLLSDMPRGDPDRLPEHFRGPDAEFVAPSAINDSSQLRYSPGKIFLGVQGATVVGKKTAHGLRRHVEGGTPIGIADDRHMVTVAGTRAGKGRSVIVPNMVLYPGSILATDFKGELATITARHRKEALLQSVAALDPFGVTRGYAVALRCGFNPLATMRPDILDAAGKVVVAGNVIESASLIADALVVVSDNDPHWDESARNFIEGVIVHVRTAPKYKDEMTLVTVQRLIAQGADDENGENPSMANLAAGMLTNRAAGGVVQRAGADFFQKPERERGAVLSTARRHLKFIDYPGIRKVLSTHDINLADLKNKPTTIYLCLPARHIGTCSRWLRLVINLTLQEMEVNLAPPAGGRPVLFCLDEFASLGKMRQIEDAAGQIAGFGVKLWPILQDLGQLKTLYKDRWETFFGNAGVLQFFGNNDITTLEWISKRLGNTTIKTRLDSPIVAAQSKDGATGESWRTEVTPLINLEEAARFFGRDDRALRQLIIIAGLPPIVLQRAYYDKHAMFRTPDGNMYDDLEERA